MNSRELFPSDVRDEMDERHRHREATLGAMRGMIQLASKAIRHAHRKQFAEAKDLLDEARGRARVTRANLQGTPAILHAGYLQDAEKEIVEAVAVLAVVMGEPVPCYASLGVDLIAYLNGMGEAASECRRTVLDEMRKGNFAEAERMLAWMEEVYDELITFDYPDSLTGGLRRTCDALRAVVERTRSDLTLTAAQNELLLALRSEVP